MKYILVDDVGTEIFCNESDFKEELLEQGQYDWDHMSLHDQNKRKAFFLMETVNPDMDAEDHYDGTLMHYWKMY